MFRVLKSLIEYQKINVILGKADSMKFHKLILELAPRVAFFFYWIFDTLIVLSKIKFLTNVDIKWITHKWASCWTFANFVGILGHIVELLELSKQEVQCIAKKRIASQDKTGQIDSNGQSQDKSLEAIKAEQRDIANKQFKQYLGIIGKTGDSITSTNLLGWDKSYLGYQFNDGLIGLGGLASGLISAYNLYPAAKK